jgi:hypothetical protein
MENSGAFLRSVAALSAAISTTPRAALRLLHRMQAAQLNLIAAHAELCSPVLEITGRMVGNAVGSRERHCIQA